MGFERSAFEELMPITVTVSTRSSHNQYGEPQYAGTPQTYRARYVRKTSFARDADGEPVAVRGTPWIASTGAITESDRITLPDGSTPRVLSVDAYSDEDGTHHHRVQLGQ